MNSRLALAIKQVQDSLELHGEERRGVEETGGE